MLTIGCHLSAAKGYAQMARDTVLIGANTFQFFTRNPRGGAAKAINESDIGAFHTLCKEADIRVILAHAPYTLNPCAENERTRAFAYETFKDDLRRMAFTPGNMYNFHPGSHVGQGIEKGIELIAQMLNALLTDDMATTVLLETMSGKGSEVGSRFEELRAIIDRVDKKHQLGVCLDTCHVYDAGYDILNDLDGVLKQFDQVIGLERLKAIHINDSKNPFASHKDRHASIGEGTLGEAFFARLINHAKLKSVPFYLETPNELDGHAREIALLKSLYAQ